MATVFPGSKHGLWTVVSKAPARNTIKLRWHCVCACGAEAVVGHNNLRSGSSKSCGCQKRRLLAEKHTTHGMNRTPTHYSWLNMISRCRHKSSPSYKEYGGRGIAVCPEWQGPTGFATFLAHMGERPSGMTLDRIDTNGNYEPSNCRWATNGVQARNKRHSRFVTYAGETLPLADWATRCGIYRSKLHTRIFTLNWPIGQALGFEPRR